MNIAICDDNLDEINFLLSLLQNYNTQHNNIFEITTFSDSNQFFYTISNTHYDLIFLDILMPKLNGLDLARAIRRFDENSKIIFLSSSPEFALDSYSVSAYQYLLKPISSKILFSLLDKILTALPIKEENFIFLKTQKSIAKIAYSEIMFLEVSKKTVSFHLSNGAIHHTYSSLIQYETLLLADSNFQKPHRSYIVNIQFIKELTNKKILLVNNHNIPISRANYAVLRKSYIDHLFDEKEFN